jgi:hypothetical protein
MSMFALTAPAHVLAVRPRNSARARAHATRRRLALLRDFAVAMSVFGTLAVAAMVLRLYVWMPAFAP